MKRRRLWSLVLISGFSVLLLTTAKPVEERVTRSDVYRWQHVNKTCRSRDCNETVNHEHLQIIESYMNASANPCESFHTYACGNWRSKHLNGTTMMKYGNDQLTAHYVELFEGWVHEQRMTERAGIQELKERRACAEQNRIPERKQLAEFQEITTVEVEMVKKREEPKTIVSVHKWQHREDLVWQKMLKYYKVCKAQYAIEEPSLHEYHKFSKSNLNWQLDDFNWLDMLARLSHYGFESHFLSASIVQWNISVHRIIIRPHEMPTDLNVTPEIYNILRSYTNQTLSWLQQRFKEIDDDLFNLNCQHCQSSTTVKDNFEDEEEECDCYDTEILTFAALKAQLTEVDWQHYLSLFLGRYVGPDEEIEIANMELIRQQLRYVQQIDPNLNMLYTLARFLEYLQVQRKSVIKHIDHKTNCVHHMRKIFHLPMLYLYERAVYTTKRSESERIVIEVFEELKAQFSLIIHRNKMEFPAQVLPYLESKLKHLRINVGNLPQNVSTQFYYDYVASYKFGEIFVENHLHALEVAYKQYNALLDVPKIDLINLWHTFNLHQPPFPDNLDSSPYYYTRSNLIVLPYAYLRTPFFDASFWPALIYGDLANTLGHELIHAFDTEFLLFDANGSPSPETLDTMRLNANFCRNVDCLKRGTKILRERIADVSGARLALNTFLNLDPHALHRNGELYFLQFAQFFCGTMDKEAFENDDHYHDPDNLRLDYVLGVLPEFSQVFNCPVGSAMNPVEKCEMYI